MDHATAQRIARELFDANRGRARYAPVEAALRDLGPEPAYEVQACYNALQQEAGVGEALGYKIALTSEVMQRLVNVGEPLAGVVFASRVAHSPATVSLADHQHVGVEFEVTVRMAADLPPPPAGAGPHTRESVAGAIASCAASFELIEDRDADYTQLNAFNLVAENAWNAGLVLGAELGDWRGLDLENGATRLWVDGQLAGEGRTGDALGHPLEAVAWLANGLNRRGRILERGMLVMTGSSIATRFPTAGEHYRFEIDGLEPVEIHWRA